MEILNTAITCVHTTPAPLIHISGSHREMGRQIGEACRQQVQHSIENTKKLIDDTYLDLQLDWASARIQASKYLPFSLERYPKYVDELVGIAEGANVPFDDVMVHNAIEAITTDALHLTKCTSFAVNEDHTSNGHVLVGHNEDWLPEEEPDVYVVHATPDDEAPFIAMSYGALLPNIGFNACGIAQCCDSVYPNDMRIGVPRVLVSRAVLAAQAPTDAIRSVLVHQRAAGYNHLLVHESGEIYNVEVSAHHFAIIGAENGFSVHTNHYLDYNMQAIEEGSEELIASRVRYFRALRLLQRTPLHSIESLQTIQRDHVSLPNSVCNHSIEDERPLDREKTINSLIIDLTDRVMYLAWGNPCQNSYHPYYLES
jgi:isopenicillin-N N-acyltransferase like protein